MRELAASLGITVTAALIIISCSGEGLVKSQVNNSQDGYTTPPGIVSCGASKSIFTATPLAPPSIMGWVPLGQMSPPAHTLPTDHQYIYLSNFGTAGAVPEPLYAPGNITITRVRKVHYSAGSVGDDYSVEFAPCRELHANFGHVRTVETAVLNALGAIDQNCSTYSPNPGLTVSDCYSKTGSYAVKAGDVIGTTAGLDLSLFDARVAPIVYANPARWPAFTDGFDHYHVVPFSDYYAEPMRSTVRAMLGSFDGKTKRTVEPIGGTLASDVPGTAQGVWVNPSQPLYPEVNHLAITPDNVDPTRITVSMGLSQPNNTPGAYQFTPVSTGSINRDPATITPSNTIYCWELGFRPGERHGVVLVALVDATTLLVETRPNFDTRCETEQPYQFGVNVFTYKR